MDLKKKFATVKNKMKDNVPLIVSVGSTVTGIAACVYAIVIVNDCKTNTIPLTKDDREMLKTGNVDIHYKIDGCDYNLTHTGPDHTD